MKSPIMLAVCFGLLVSPALEAQNLKAVKIGTRIFTFFSQP